jgi:hypothetical protein
MDILLKIYLEQILKRKKQNFWSFLQCLSVWLFLCFVTNCHLTIVWNSKFWKCWIKILTKILIGIFALLLFPIIFESVTHTCFEIFD